MYFVKVFFVYFFKDKVLVDWWENENKIKDDLILKVYINNFIMLVRLENYRKFVKNLLKM